jgi:hypothetical protein
LVSSYKIGISKRARCEATIYCLPCDAYKMLRGEREGGREAAVIRHPHSLLISYV